MTIAYDSNTAEDARNPAYARRRLADPYDIIIHDECTASLRDMDFINKVLQPHKDGKPAVVLHCGMHSFRTEGWDSTAADPTPWFELTGLRTTGHGAQLPIEIFYTDPENPITKGLENWTTGNEELYNNSGGLLATTTPLARGGQAAQNRGGRRGGGRQGGRGAGGVGRGPAADAPNTQPAQPAEDSANPAGATAQQDNGQGWATPARDGHHLDQHLQ